MENNKNIEERPLHDELKVTRSGNISAQFISF